VSLPPGNQERAAGTDHSSKQCADHANPRRVHRRILAARASRIGWGAGISGFGIAIDEIIGEKLFAFLDLRLIRVKDVDRTGRCTSSPTSASHAVSAATKGAYGCCST
jgi:hypothetical protein